MVSLALRTLNKRPDAFEIHHVNARFSNTLEDIGDSSLEKLGLSIKYLYQAIRIRMRINRPILYYIPGPVKWSSLLRDWALLTVLRSIYPKVVFHWHAIGHGEWAHGSDRLTLDGPRWVDRFARKISARVLEAPYASIAVSENSQKDSRAVGSRQALVINNGIEDPCPDFDRTVAPVKRDQSRAIHETEHKVFRILFLSHGTLEKGIIDALDCMEAALEACPPDWCFETTFVGGISELIVTRFDSIADKLVSKWPGRIKITKRAYLSGDEKHRCFVDHDVFLAPSRWESFGLTVIEAMAHGMPIVAAASDGVQGVLPNDYPYLSPVAEPAALATNLIACCSNLGTENSLKQGRALRERYLSLFQIKDFANQLTRSFLELGARSAAEAGINNTHPDSGFHSSDAQRDSTRNTDPPLTLQVYLADQNPGHDRSYGISRMSQVVLDALQRDGRVIIETITSRTSQQAPASVKTSHVLPWGTRRKLVRLLTDHFHPLFESNRSHESIHYFPKGYLPLLSGHCKPSVVTIHDTIIQYDEDFYPKWRRPWEYGYWAMMLRHTLRNSDRILTVSESSRRQIQAFMDRHEIPRKPVTVTYEPCLYEHIPQPEQPEKDEFVIHLASVEPHKRTAHLIRWWHEEEAKGRPLPLLHLIGTVPPEAIPLVAKTSSITKRPFLEDSELQLSYQSARALILPSEIEGFGLPALEAYYLGTPVCFVEGTSVEEILSVVTRKGAFTLDSKESLLTAMDEVMAMSSEEIRQCGLALRETYAAEKVADRMVKAFRCVPTGT